MSTWPLTIMSIIALLVSVATAWLTLFRRGKLVITQPALIYLGPDGSPGLVIHNKVYIRALLHSTAKKGQVIEYLYVSLQRNESKQNFNVWVYGETDDLRRGSGLFISHEGIVCDHHFLLPDDGAEFRFHPGQYTLKIYAKPIGRSTTELKSINLLISESDADTMREANKGIYFDWGPDQESYNSHIDKNYRLKLDNLDKLKMYAKMNNNYELKK